MKTIQVAVQPAPSSPLNLQFGVTYAPRVETPPFVGFAAVEMRPNVFEIRAYDEVGGMAVVFTGALIPTFERFAKHLRMDVDTDATDGGSDTERQQCRDAGRPR